MSGIHDRRRIAQWPGWAACGVALAGFGLCLWLWLTGGGALSLPWAPSLGLRLRFSLDGLGALYALVATGIGAVVFGYGAGYLPRHLRWAERPERQQGRFWAWMLVFAVSMVGLALAQDVILLFLLFDLTAICSYFLIGFDRHEPAARTGALMSLLVTIVSAVAMLIAAALFMQVYGTFSIPQLIEDLEPGRTATVTGVLLAVAAVAKSAQVPLHFWLPRAMVAPTPVSAYLHSAAMVAAGVLVLGRVHPLLAHSEPVLNGLVVVGAASVLVGGILALGRDQLKQVLAYSTISQYGYMVLLYGIGGAAGNGAAAFYVLVHAVAKSALFMTAGAVTLATGEDRLSRLGGLGRRAPLLALGSGIAAATLAAVPLTVGFFKDELFFRAALAEGPWYAALAVVAAGLTFAYIARFWGRLFLGGELVKGAAPPWTLVAPTMVLAVISVVFGVVVQPFQQLAEAAAGVSHAGVVDLAPGYDPAPHPENLMALGAWGIGGALLFLPRLSAQVSGWCAWMGQRWGPQRAYTGFLHGLTGLSDGIHRREVGNLRNSIAAVLVPAAGLVGLAFLATPTTGVYALGSVSDTDWLVLPLLALIAIATVAVTRTRARLPLVLALAVVGFALAAVYALFSAPDVALVAVVVETMITLVFLAALARLPPRRRRPGRGRSSRPARTTRPRWGQRQVRDVTAGTVAGLGMFVAVWGFLSQPARSPDVAAEQLKRTPEAHGQDVVTVIVADFRGLDTLGEITVLFIAVAGVAGLMRKGRLW